MAARVQYLNRNHRAALCITGKTGCTFVWAEHAGLVALLDERHLDGVALLQFDPGLVGEGTTPLFIPRRQRYGSRRLGPVTTQQRWAGGFGLMI